MCSLCFVSVMCFFFKQKTAYEMRISDWSSDVCSSDLALQAGTSHFLGTTFSKAQNIRFQNREGELELAQTTSWGVSTRLIGGVIMTHGDDDGLRVPPIIAPQQIVIVPMLRDQPEDEDIQIGRAHV